MTTFDFWLKSFWLWFSFTLLWKRGPKVEYPQPFPHDFTQIFDDNGVLSSWNWVLATVQMPALMPSGLPLRAQAFKEIEPAHSNYPTSLTRSDSTTILFVSFEQYWNYLVSYFSQCGEKIIALVRAGRPSSFGDKLQLLGQSATKIEPSGRGSNLEWSHCTGRVDATLIRPICNQYATNSHPPDYSATVNQQEGDLFWPCLDGEGGLKFL